MPITIQQQGPVINIKVNSAKIEGTNALFSTIIEQMPFSSDIKTVSFDFSKVEYINSLGMAEIMSIYRNLGKLNDHEIHMVICEVEPKIAKVFNLVELAELIEIRERAAN